MHKKLLFVKRNRDKDVLIITGPTASGKTKLSYLITKSIQSEIIVADSMKVYKGADIGTNMPAKEYQNEIKYHLLNIREPNDRYDVGSFYRDTISLIDSMHLKGITPIVCGGTSLYIVKLIEGLAKMPVISKNIIEELSKKETKALYGELKEIDPKRAKEVHPNMRKRIIRAIGIYRETGIKMSEFISKTSPPPYNFIVLTIKWEREVLYGLINKRVDKMIGDGFIEEAEELYKRYTEKAPIFDGVGYSQILEYIKGEISKDVLIEKIKQATRNYARRQLTWWRKRNIIYLDGDKIRVEEGVEGVG